MKRTERDLLGEIELDDAVLYGIHTTRALGNFDFSGRLTSLELIHALAEVKIACAAANHECGTLDAVRADAIRQAARETIAGDHDAHFPLDALQGGAGTSTNMNVNEVLARRAAVLCGQQVDPLDHVNLHQSTNDTYGTALRIAAIRRIQSLEKAVIGLQEAYQEKEREFASVVKIGRTQLRDAVPLTLGREFGAAASALSRDRWRVFKCIERLRVVNIGGTAVGTGIAAPRDYIFGVIEHLRATTGLALARAENLVDATQNADVFVEVSGILRAHATNLMKFARDLRLLSSGPAGGLGEITLPALQAGSSLMPGKVNPVIPEAVMQASMRVHALDAEIAMAASAGELELNAFMPLIADALLTMLSILCKTNEGFAGRCVRGITANVERCRAFVEASTETITALIPVIGHQRAVELARRILETGMTIPQAVETMQLLTPEELASLLSAESVCALGWRTRR